MGPLISRGGEPSPKQNPLVCMLSTAAATKHTNLNIIYLLKEFESWNFITIVRFSKVFQLQKKSMWCLKMQKSFVLLWIMAEEYQEKCLCFYFLSTGSYWFRCFEVLKVYSFKVWMSTDALFVKDLLVFLMDLCVFVVDRCVFFAGIILEIIKYERKISSWQG